MNIFQPTRARHAVLAVAALCTAAFALVPLPAEADDSSTVTFVGTSDTFDSGLVSHVLKPGFEAAHPEYKFNYVSQGTDAAIAYANQGNASGLLVHAASLENTFVKDGFSNEKYGRAVFWGDYVLIGPKSDPAGVLTGAPHDVVRAFEKIAAAGAAGTADFVSRGKAPGTTVAEHAIWAETAGVPTCAVPAGSGGGTSPYNGTGACVSVSSYPDWYHVSGATQGPNLTIANACNFSNRSGKCYTLTDRGTFNYLQTHPAGSIDTVDDLKVVVRDNDVSAKGGPNLLVNSFHAYAVNPAKFANNPNVQLNTKGATAFLDWLTSPAGQKLVSEYLNQDTPFIPSAAPALTASALPGQLAGGKSFTVTGNLKNVVPGTPALDNVTVSLLGATKSVPVPVTSAKTDAAGNYSITFTPRATMTYSLAVGPIEKIENADLNPVFGDLLAPVSKPLRTVTVVGAPKITKITKITKKGKHGKKIKYVRVRGTLAPGVVGTHGHLSLYGAVSGTTKTKGYRLKSSKALKDGATKFDVTFRLSSKKWTLKVAYVNSGVVKAGYSGYKRVNLR